METKESSLKSVEIDIDHLILNDNNANEMSEDDLKKLCTNISEVGFLEAVLVVPTQNGKYLMMSGEHRWRAAKRLGMTSIPSVILSDEKFSDMDLVDLTSFRMNHIKGSVNLEKFLKLHARLAAKYGADSLKDVFAMTDKSLWKKLTKSIKTDLKKAGVPEDVVAQLDKADKKSKDFNQFTKYMNKIFSDQATKMKNGCILFSMGNEEHLVVQANQSVFDSMKALSSFSSSVDRNINDYLEDVLLNLLKDLKMTARD